MTSNKHRNRRKKAHKPSTSESVGIATAGKRRKVSGRSTGSTKAKAPTAAGSATAQAAAEGPGPEDLAIEQTLLDEELQNLRNQTATRPDPGTDLLASYISGLRHIPLFTPERELENAKHLETLDLQSWRLILQTPRGAYHTHAEATELATDLYRDLGALVESYRRAAARSRTRVLKASPARDGLIDKLCLELRFADCDKELLEVIMTRLRRDVWNRRVFDASPAFRVSHAQLTEIEKACGTALRARNNFVRANLRLVVSVARNFHHYQVPFIDLIQEGNVGLMKAVHRFDHRRGFRFSTYAHWWIRQSVERAIINKGSQVRLPVHVIDARRQVRRAQAKLTPVLKRSPTVDEIAQETQFGVAKVEQILNGIHPDPVSLDETMSSDDQRKFVDMLKDEDAPIIDEALIRENTYDCVRELLSYLNPIEKDILRRRFGLGDDSDQTLDEIGKSYNLSRERVRQIQAQGLQKMRKLCERRQIQFTA